MGTREQVNSASRGGRRTAAGGLVRFFQPEHAEQQHRQRDGAQAGEVRVCTLPLALGLWRHCSVARTKFSEATVDLQRGFCGQCLC